jgi:hypothetical protein
VIHSRLETRAKLEAKNLILCKRASAVAPNWPGESTRFPGRAVTWHSGGAQFFYGARIVTMPPEPVNRAGAIG